MCSLIRYTLTTITVTLLVIAVYVYESKAEMNTAPTFIVGSGILSTDFGLMDTSSGTVIKPDGKIISVGVSVDNFRYLVAVARYNSDGSLDKKITTDIGSSQGSFARVALQPDGKIIVATTSDYTSDRIVLLRYEESLLLDTTFGDGGVVRTSVGSGDESASDVLLQTDGKIIVAGSSYDSGKWGLAVIRYNSDGTLDTGFDDDGIVTTLVGSGNTYGRRIAIQSDGKILVVGSSNSGSGWRLAVARYNINGTLDTSFANDGIVTTLDLSDNTYARGISIQSDGKILVAGSSNTATSRGLTLVKYNANGTADVNFGVNGIVTSENGTVSDMIIQPDGKILVSGSNNTQFTLVRYNSDGTLDTELDQDGMVTTDVGVNGGSSEAVTIQSDGKIILSGSGYAYDFVLVRYESNGELDRRYALEDTLNVEPVYTEGTAGIVLSAKVSIYDEELSKANSYEGATLTITRSPGSSEQDVFFPKSAGTLVSLDEGEDLTVDGILVGLVNVNSNGIIRLTFNANATEALVSKAMQCIAYRNTSDNPPPSLLLEWVFDDGNSGNQGEGGAMTVTDSIVIMIAPVNDNPTIANVLENQAVDVNIPFTYTIPENTFFDPDGDILTYSISMANGSALPLWLNFDQITKTFYGTPVPDDKTIYDIRVYAKDAAGVTVWSNIRFTIVYPVADTPMALIVPRADSDGAYNISWTASGTPDVTYVLEEASSQNFNLNVKEVYRGTNLNASIPQKDQGLTYYYRVKAVKYAFVDSPWKVANNGCAVPGVYQVLKPESIIVPVSDSNGDYTISWTPSITRAVVYVLDEATDPIFTMNRKEVYRGKNLSVNLLGRSLNTTYYYRLRAFKPGFKDSPVLLASNGCALPGTDTISPPKGLSLPSADEDGAYSVSWAASTTPDVTYVLEEATNPIFTEGHRLVYVGTNLNASVTGRLQKRTYYYRVRAVKPGMRDSIKKLALKGCAVPGIMSVGIPQSVEVPTSNLGGSYTVNWLQSSTAGVKYLLQEATKSDFTQGIRDVYYGQGLGAYIEGRTLGKTYYYRVYAVRPGWIDSDKQMGSNGCVVSP